MKHPDARRFLRPGDLFPQRRGEIEALASATESFRSLCDDLAEAAAALEKWTELGTPAGQRNAQEYRALVASFTAELEAALNVARANPQQLPDRDELIGRAPTYRTCDQNS